MYYSKLIQLKLNTITKTCDRFIVMTKSDFVKNSRSVLMLIRNALNG